MQTGAEVADSRCSEMVSNESLVDQIYELTKDRIMTTVSVQTRKGKYAAHLVLSDLRRLTNPEW